MPTKDELDFGKPGPVGRDYLTEGWVPQEKMRAPKSVIESLCIEDLRPFLGQLNWQLRRIEKRISVNVEDDGRIVGVELLDGQVWKIGCDSCGEEYTSTAKIPTCPKCGSVEGGEILNA